MSDTLPVMLLVAVVGVGAYAAGKQQRQRKKARRERVPKEVMAQAIANDQPVVRAHPDVITDDEVIARYEAHRSPISADAVAPVVAMKHANPPPRSNAVQGPPPSVVARPTYYVPQYLAREQNANIATEESGVESYVRSSATLRAMADAAAPYQRTTKAAAPLADDVPTVERVGAAAGAVAKQAASVPKYLSRAAVAAGDEAVHQAGLFRKGWRNAFGEIS